MIAWIRSYLGASKKLLAQVLVLGVTAVVFAIGLMFVAGYLIAASADNAFSLLMLNIPLAFVQIFGLGKPLARYFERLRSHDWVLRLTSTLRLRLFRVVQHQQREQAEMPARHQPEIVQRPPRGGRHFSRARVCARGFRLLSFAVRHGTILPRRADPHPRNRRRRPLDEKKTSVPFSHPRNASG